MRGGNRGWERGTDRQSVRVTETQRKRKIKTCAREKDCITLEGEGIPQETQGGMGREEK